MADTLTREAIAYGSQPLSPVPQYWDGASYAKVQGINGATRIINYNSAGETFTGASPGSVQLTATSTVAISGTSTIAISGTSTVTFSGTETVVISGTSTVNYSGSATIEVVTSAGGTTLFTSTKAGNVSIAYPPGSATIYTATVTWSSGTTATSSQTITIGVITASLTTQNLEIAITNDGPYAITSDYYKQISANGTTFLTATLLTIVSPVVTISAGVTINAGRGSATCLFNHNKGVIIRLTTTATFTATVTNNIIFKEFN